MYDVILRTVMYLVWKLVVADIQAFWIFLRNCALLLIAKKETGYYMYLVCIYASHCHLLMQWK